MSDRECINEPDVLLVAWSHMCPGREGREIKIYSVKCPFCGREKIHEPKSKLEAWTHHCPNWDCDITLPVADVCKICGASSPIDEPPENDVPKAICPNCGRVMRIACPLCGIGIVPESETTCMRDVAPEPNKDYKIDTPKTNCEALKIEKRALSAEITALKAEAGRQKRITDEAAQKARGQISDYMDIQAAIGAAAGTQIQEEFLPVKIAKLARLAKESIKLKRERDRQAKLASDLLDEKGVAETALAIVRAEVYDALDLDPDDVAEGTPWECAISEIEEHRAMTTERDEALTALATARKHIGLLPVGLCHERDLRAAETALAASEKEKALIIRGDQSKDEQRGFAEARDNANWLGIYAVLGIDSIELPENVHVPDLVAEKVCELVTTSEAETHRLEILALEMAARERKAETREKRLREAIETHRIDTLDPHTADNALYVAASRVEPEGESPDGDK